MRFEHTGKFADVQSQLGVSLLVSTSQAAKLLSVGTHQGQLVITLHGFDRPMGVAVHPRRIAVGSRTAVWVLRSTWDIAPRMGRLGQHAACFLARTSHPTGEIHGHDLAWAGDELWVVNTLFSCLCTLDDEFSFVPRWKPPFISALAAEDRCHLNGLALGVGGPRFVTALAECDTAAGWRPTKANSGCVLDIPGVCSISPEGRSRSAGAVWG